MYVWRSDSNMHTLDPIACFFQKHQGYARLVQLLIGKTRTFSPAGIAVANKPVYHFWYNVSVFQAHKSQAFLKTLLTSVTSAKSGTRIRLDFI